MIKKLKTIPKIPVLFFLAGIFFFAKPAQATSPTDYVAVTNLNKYYTERLQAQSRQISEDLAYVRESIPKFDVFVEKVEKLNGAIQRCNERIQNNKIDVCTVQFQGRYIPLVDAQAKANELNAKLSLCRKSKEEAISDERQLSKRLGEIDTIIKDLEAWKRDNDEAVVEGLQAVAEFIFGQFVSYLSDQAASASALKGALTKYQNQLAKEGVDVRLVMPKIQDAYNKYLTAQVTAFTGKTLKETQPIALVSYIRNTASAVVIKDSEACSEMKQLLSNPTVKKYLQKDRPNWAAADRFIQVGTEAILKSRKLWDIIGVKGTSKFVPAIAITVLIRDTGYSGMKWWFSLQNITLRYELSEKSATAVKSLHSLIERRKAKWQQFFL